MGDLLLFHFRVTNVKLINEKNPISISSNVRKPLEISTIPYFFQEPPTTECLGAFQACSSVGVTWMWSPIHGSLSGFCLGTTYLLVPETFKFKVLIT